MTTIQINNVTKRIKKATVVNNVSMRLSSNRITGLRGINGSGKTMLMRLISGLILPTEGEIIVNDKVLGKDIAFPNSIGILIENPSFLDSYSGFDNLKMLASIREEIDDARIKDVLQQVGLDPYDKKKYRKYSLGMKERLGIAGAILEKPDIIILDEPTNALDSDGIELVKQIVSQEKERGALVIISCHDTHILEKLADDIYFLDNGELMESGNVKEGEL